MRLMGKVMRYLLMCIMILGFMIPQNAYAIDRMDEERPVSLHIDYRGAGKNIVGTGVWIYKIADVSGFGEFELAGDFAKYPVEVNGLDAEGWRLLAETLEIYVLRDEIEATDFASVGEDGMAHFPASQQEMTKGLYLVVSQNYIDEEQNYTYTPILICLPNRDVNDEWIYEETIYPKDGPADETTELQVIKIWKDSNNEKVRPKEIEVELLKDGKVCQTVKLNKDNNWRYEWTMLEKGHEWKVAEKKVPNGYKVSIGKEEAAYVITNTYEPPTPPNTPPNLPQTGMLWWPVPILAGAGMLFFMIGWVKRHKCGE